MYTIGQVSKKFGLPISTLRYYDKEGLFPNMQRISGIRKFDEKAARSAGALCAKDCFDESYRYDWYNDETDSWWNYQCQYNNEKYALPQ